MFFGKRDKKKKRSTWVIIAGFVTLLLASIVFGIEFSLGLIASTSGLGFLLWDGFSRSKGKKEKGGNALFLRLLLLYTGAGICGLLAAITMSQAGFSLPIAAMTGFAAVLVVVLVVKLLMHYADRDDRRKTLRKKQSIPSSASPSRKRSKR